jgi:hypothetical protein
MIKALNVVFTIVLVASVANSSLFEN